MWRERRRRTPGSEPLLAEALSLGADTDHAKRWVHVNDPQANHRHHYAPNVVHTSKYTVLSFLPLNLLDQFSKPANQYFLVVCVLVAIPLISPVQPFTTLLPFMFVLTVSAVREAIEDYRRHKADDCVNKRKAMVLREGRAQEILCENIVVGDIVCVSRNEAIPADLLCLLSEKPNGLVHVETALIDGETNFKSKFAVHATHALPVSQLRELRGIAKTEQPNNKLDSFDASIEFSGSTLRSAPIPLDISCLLLRGCVLRNTEFVYGLAVATGHETKMMHSISTHHKELKQSAMEHKMHQMLKMVILLQLCFIVPCAISHAVFLHSKRGNGWYVAFEGSTAASGALSALTFLVLFNVMVPISLYVSLEVVRVFQAMFINYDLTMATPIPPHEANRERDRECSACHNWSFATAKTSTLGEELGAIDFVLTDKTGTLTTNVMELTGVCAGDRVVRKVGGAFEPQAKAWRESAQESVMFLLSLCVCNTVRCTRTGGKIAWEAESPDEQALVEGASEMGWRLEKTEDGCAVVRVSDEELRFEILKVIPFSSARRRMSAVVRFPQSVFGGGVWVLCKGADSTVLDLLCAEGRGHERAVSAALTDFSSEGLRTLCCAYARCNDDTIEDWVGRFNAATVARDASQLEALAHELEQGLVLAGATAIHDQLQADLPHSLTQLRRANIKVWVLTGDKLETAVAIAHSCGLAPPDTVLMQLDTPDEDVGALIDQMVTVKKEHFQAVQSNPTALVVSGKFLEKVWENDLQRLFVRIACLFHSVVVCRALPVQKAQVVESIKQFTDLTTLAIGDGGNDVPMIRTAHVGVGIRGKEGSQAALSADYAIDEFKHLTQLLLVHGRWSHHRNSQLILYSFYKNLTLASLQLWYAFWDGFSGQTFYSGMLQSTFNLLFTGLPVLCFAVLDRDIPAHIARTNPHLYKTRFDFGFAAFRHWMCIALWHSLVCFCVCMLAFSYSRFTPSAKGQDHWITSTSAYVAVVLVTNIKLALCVRTWSWPVALSFFVSVVLVFAFVYMLSAGVSFFSRPLAEEMVGVAGELFSMPVLWVCVLLCCGAALVPDVFVRCLAATAPSPPVPLPMHHLTPSHARLAPSDSGSGS